MGLSLCGFSSYSGLHFRLYFDSLPSLRFQAPLACSLACTRRAPSVRRSVRSPFASAVELATLPYTLQRSNVSHGILYPPLACFAYLSLSHTLFLSLLLSLSLSLECSLFISFLSYLHPTLRDFFLLSIPVKTTLFSEFLLCMHYLLPIESRSVSF